MEIYDFVKSYDNEKYYNTIQPIDYLVYKLTNSPLKIKILSYIKKLETNEKLMNEYKEKVNNITSFGLFNIDGTDLELEKLKQFEKEIFSSLIKKIVIHPLVKVTINLKNSYGHIQDSKDKIFDKKEILYVIDELKRYENSYNLYASSWISDALIRIERAKVTNKLRFKIYERDGYRCKCCGRRDTEVSLEIDHIVPIYKGGKTVESNLQTLCHDCNQNKGIKIIRY